MCHILAVGTLSDAGNDVGHRGGGQTFVEGHYGVSLVIIYCEIAKINTVKFE